MDVNEEDEVEYKRQRRLLYNQWCWVTTKEQLDRMAMNIVLTQKRKQI